MHGGNRSHLNTLQTSRALSDPGFSLISVVEACLFTNIKLRKKVIFLFVGNKNKKAVAISDLNE